MPYLPAIGERSVSKVSWSRLTTNVLGSILTAWKTKQWHEPVSSFTTRTPPLWCWPSWRKSNANSRQSMSTGRQWEQVALSRSNPLTGTSATDIRPWPCRLITWETKPWSKPNASPSSVALITRESPLILFVSLIANQLPTSTRQSSSRILITCLQGFSLSHSIAPWWEGQSRCWHTLPPNLPLTL